MSVIVDVSQLTSFEKNILDICKNKYPKEAKNFMQRAGNSLKKDIRKQYESDGVGKKTGNLRKGLTRGRAYVYAGNEYQVRVKNKAPHAHLIEHGHELFFHHAQKHNFTNAKYSGEYVQGSHSVGKASKNFGGDFSNLTEKFVDDFLNKGFG